MYHCPSLTASELRRIAGANRQSRQLAQLHVAIIERLQVLLTADDDEMREGVAAMLEYLTQEPTQH